MNLRMRHLLGLAGIVGLIAVGRGLAQDTPAPSDTPAPVDIPAEPFPGADQSALPPAGGDDQPASPSPESPASGTADPAGSGDKAQPAAAPQGYQPGPDDLPPENQGPAQKYGDETSVPVTEAERKAGTKARTYGDGVLYRVKTDDGWQIALQYYEATSSEKLYPVVLVHGEGMNRYIFDFGRSHSLARYLASRGYPTYVVELRGHGLSSVELAAPSMKTTWVFEDYLKDVQAAMNFAAQQFEIDKVLLVGHSTGGTLVYGIMEDERFGKMVAGSVTLGAPLIYNHPNETMLALFNNRDKLFQHRELSEVTTRHAYYLPAPFAKNTDTLLGALFFNDFFLNKNRVERFLDHGIENVRVDILRQMSLWLQEERVYGTEDTAVRYLDDLNLIKNPVCMMTGWRDNFVEPETVLAASELIEPGLRKVVNFGKVNGHNDNYGHLGYLLNDYAPEDVYPEVGRCLQEWTDRATAEEAGTKARHTTEPEEQKVEEPKKPEEKIEEKERQEKDLKPEEVPFQETGPGF